LPIITRVRRARARNESIKSNEAGAITNGKDIKLGPKGSFKCNYRAQQLYRAIRVYGI
jgi:hypothetical protein